MRSFQPAAPARLRKWRNSSYSLPPPAPASSAAPLSTSTAAIRSTGRTHDRGQVGSADTAGLKRHLEYSLAKLQKPSHCWRQALGGHVMLHRVFAGSIL